MHSITSFNEESIPNNILIYILKKIILLHRLLSILNYVQTLYKISMQIPRIKIESPIFLKARNV